MRLGRAKVFLLIAVAFLAASVVLGVVSLFPVYTGVSQSNVIIDDTFHLSTNEVRRQGIGSFHGAENSTAYYFPPENVSIVVESSDFVKNFSIVTYSNASFLHKTTNLNFSYTFVAGADYYEAVFSTNATQTGTVHFEVTVQSEQVTYPLAVFTTFAKILFLLSVGAALLLLAKLQLAKPKLPKVKVTLPSLSKNGRRNLQALVLASLIFWLILLAVNGNPLGTFENWYTDHARHPYVSSLFLKDGFSVFSQPLDALASRDNSYYEYVTWPEMPHLYPLGSILLFIPFGVLLQNGLNALLIYKLEIASFLVFAHACLYFFLARYWPQTNFPQMTLKNAKTNLRILSQPKWKDKAPLIDEYLQFLLKLVGVYVIYTTLIVYAADGMFDSVALLFLLFALTMFLLERYDFFLLFVAVSAFFKYQTIIFLCPIIVVGLVKLLQENKFGVLLRNWKVIAAVVFIALTGFTAYLSAPYLMQTRAEFVMNGINGFLPHAQIDWVHQSSAVLLALTGTLIYAIYMFNKNSLLSISALFLLVPSFMLPYFQNWYLPFIFIYILIPQRRDEFTATGIWLIFLLVMLSFGGAAFNPLMIIDNFRATLHL